MDLFISVILYLTFWLCDRQACIGLVLSVLNSVSFAFVIRVITRALNSVDYHTIISHNSCTILTELIVLVMRV